MRFVIPIALLAIFFTGWKLGAEENRNAASWNDHSATERMMYTNGYMEGFINGSIQSGLTVTISLTHKYHLPISTAASVNPVKLERMRLELRDQIGNSVNKHVNSLEIQNGINSFYRDFRNSSVCWSDAFKFSAMSLNGDVPTDRELIEARKSGAQTDCR